jgi:hypothetical protein
MAFSSENGSMFISIYFTKSLYGGAEEIREKIIRIDYLLTEVQTDHFPIISPKH